MCGSKETCSSRSEGSPEKSKCLPSLAQFLAQTFGTFSVPIGLSATDIGFLFEEIWRGRSAVSGVFEKLVLVRWDASKPLTYGNIVCLTRQEAAEHDSLESMEAVKDHYRPDILDYIQRRMKKEAEENEWRLHYC